MGPEGKSRERDWKMPGRERDENRVRPGLCDSSIVEVFGVHESSGFVDVVDNCSNVYVIKNVVG